MMKWSKLPKALFQNNDFVHNASVFINVCLINIFPSMCTTRLTSYIISLNDKCWILKYWGIECVKLPFSPRFVSLFLFQFVTDVHAVERKWFTGCGDWASLIFFVGVSILITSGWVLVAFAFGFIKRTVWSSWHCFKGPHVIHHQKLEAICKL